MLEQLKEEIPVENLDDNIKKDLSVLPGKRIFLYEFVWSETLIRHIKQLCNEKGIEICGWAIREKDVKGLVNVWPEAPVYEAPLPSNCTVIDFDINLPHNFSFQEEENIRFLLDREGEYQNNMHSSQARYEVLAWVETLLQSTKPDWLLFPDVPHNIFTYLLYLCGRRHGIRILMIRRGLAPHLFTLSETLDRNSIPISHASGNTELSSQTTEYLEALKFGDEVSPTYMQEQRKNAKTLQILKRSLAKGLNLFTRKSIGAALAYAKRKRLKEFYESECESELDLTNNGPYIVAFLHLQPERSTMPEGGIFAQQWLMVQMLAHACSREGWRLYVKEHPSTFIFGPKLYRGRWFYSGLKLLPNVSLVSTSVNSTSILKNAKAVATVTGTVGIEAIVKGIPALLFGESPYIGCVGTHRVKSQADLKNAVLSIKSGVEIEFDDVSRFYRAWENSKTCHNTKLHRTADHNSIWLKGNPQAAMFSKMADIIEAQGASSINKEKEKDSDILQ